MTITGFEDVEEMLNKLANPCEMAEKAVNKAAPIVEKNLKTQIRSAANRRDKYGKTVFNRRTGSFHSCYKRKRQ